MRAPWVSNPLSWCGWHIALPVGPSVEPWAHVVCGSGSGWWDRPGEWHMMRQVWVTAGWDGHVGVYADRSESLKCLYLCSFQHLPLVEDFHGIDPFCVFHLYNSNLEKRQTDWQGGGERGMKNAFLNRQLEIRGVWEAASRFLFIHLFIVFTLGLLWVLLPRRETLTNSSFWYLMSTNSNQKRARWLKSLLKWLKYKKKKKYHNHTIKRGKQTWDGWNFFLNKGL